MGIAREGVVLAWDADLSHALVQAEHGKLIKVPVEALVIVDAQEDTP